MTIITYYSIADRSPVVDFIDSLGVRQKRKIFHIFRAIQTYGIGSATAHIKKLAQTPFYELRILGADNIRLFYLPEKNDTIIILYGCVKKAQKTSTKDLNAVYRAYYNLKNRLDK